MFYSTLFSVQEYSLGNFSCFEEKFIQQYQDRGYSPELVEKKKKDIGAHSYMFVHYYISSLKDNHRCLAIQFYVPYCKYEKIKYKYQVLGMPNTLRQRTALYIYSRVSKVVHLPAFNYIEMDTKTEGDKIFVRFGDQTFEFPTKTQARKLFPSQAVGLVRSTLPLVEIKSILNNLISRNISFSSWECKQMANIMPKIYDFISEMKLDNYLTDHEIYELFCKYYRPYDTYLLYKFL